MAKQRYCSFCGKAEQEVDRLVAGPQTYICNECIDLMHDMIHTTPKPPSPDDTKTLAELKEFRSR